MIFILLPKILSYVQVILQNMQVACTYRQLSEIAAIYDSSAAACPSVRQVISTLPAPWSAVGVIWF